MADREHGESTNPDPLPDPQNQVAPQESHKENDERKKGILKHARTYSNKHVDFNMDLEFVPFDETKDFTIEIQIVEKMPKKVVSYAALFAEQKAQEEEEERKKQEETKVKCKKVPNSHIKKSGSCKSKKCKLASNSAEGSEGIKGEAHSTDSFNEELQISHNQEEDHCQCESSSEEPENNIQFFSECESLPGVGQCQSGVDVSVNGLQIPSLYVSEIDSIAKIKETTIDTKSYETNSEEKAANIDSDKAAIQLIESNNTLPIAEKNEHLHNGLVQITDQIGTEDMLQECHLEFEESLIKQEEDLRLNAVDEKAVDLHKNSTNSQNHLTELPGKEQLSKLTESHNTNVNSLVEPAVKNQTLEDPLHSEVDDNKIKLGSTMEQEGESKKENGELNPREINKAGERSETHSINYEPRPVEVAYLINHDTSVTDQSKSNNENHKTSKIIGTIVGNNNDISIESKDDIKELIIVLETNDFKTSSMERETPAELKISEKENEINFSQNQLQNTSIPNGHTLENENKISLQSLTHISNGENALKEFDKTTSLHFTAKEGRKNTDLNLQREAKEYTNNMTGEDINGTAINFEGEGGKIFQYNYPTEDVLSRENIMIKSKEIGDIIETEKLFYDSKKSNEIDEKRECILS